MQINPALCQRKKATRKPGSSAGEWGGGAGPTLHGHSPIYAPSQSKSGFLDQSFLSTAFTAGKSLQYKTSSKSIAHRKPEYHLIAMAETDTFLAKPSGNCCLKGSLHEGAPRGKMVAIADVETYLVAPPENKANGHILLYFPDVWGFFNNGFLIMDGFADAGYLVLGLDYFRGVNYPAK